MVRASSAFLFVCPLSFRPIQAAVVQLKDSRGEWQNVRASRPASLVEESLTRCLRALGFDDDQVVQVTRADGPSGGRGRGRQQAGGGGSGDGHGWQGGWRSSGWGARTRMSASSEFLG